MPVRRLDDLRCLFLKVKRNLAPLAAAVCLIQVGRGGDFLFACQKVTKGAVERPL